MAKAVAVKEAGAMTVPDFMKAQAGLGTESVGTDSVEVPRIKLMQDLSPELESYNELKSGDFWHTLAEMNLGAKVRVTPIYVTQRFILWRPRKSGGGILARADDGIHWEPRGSSFQVKLDNGKEVIWKTLNTVADSGLDRWGSSDPQDPNSPPAATRMFNLVVTLADDPDMPPAVVTLQRASIKVARKLIGKMKITRAPSFGLVFEMSSIREQSPSGKFSNFSFKADGLVTNETTYKHNLQLYEYFKEQGVAVKDLEEAQNDDVPVEETKF